MMSRERKKAAALQEKLQLLRSLTHSHALSNTSIIMDASKYIKELKQKVVMLNQEIACAAQDSCSRQTTYPTNLVENVDEHVVKQAVLRACSSHSGGGGNKQT
ncbi:hypothetical protein CFC21_052163 [Triticum aestivum]|uniref:BHLH domain-containing protein n=4 Tax=Triticum TaxID=4564 RepID=A0A9R0S8P6_TRITD|nr:hypothetical protein CFC21_052163 [Triticum aestivum]VAH90776.1 unnamed protein product [Triticum turgidum subsp. durum]